MKFLYKAAPNPLPPQNPRPQQQVAGVPAPVPQPMAPRINPGMSPNIGPAGASDQEKVSVKILFTKRDAINDTFF